MSNKSLRSVGRDESAVFGDRLPPQNLDAEKSLLGALMLSKDAFLAVEELRPEDFYRDRNARIFEAMLELRARGEPIDHLTLSNALQTKGTLEQVGGLAYIGELMVAVPTTANVAYYAKIVGEKSTLRKLITTTTDVSSRAFEANEPVEELLDDAEKKILEIAKGNVQRKLEPISTIVYKAVENLQDIFQNQGAVTGLPTGFDRFDRMTSGLQPGALYILAARPGMGKTSLVLNMAAHAAIHQEKAVAFFSLEMSKEELVTRMLCAEGRIDMADLRNGMMPVQAWEHLTRAASRLSAAPIYIDDHGLMDIRYIMGKCRRQAAEGKLDLVIIDYLQLMSGSKPTERREQEISEISRGLKAMAKDLKIPVIALSQLNRAVEQRPDKRPHMADLRESGAIEQDADLIGFIYRPQVYAKDDKERQETADAPAEFIIAKHRSGPTGMVKLAFVAKHTRFENYVEDDAYGPPPAY